jgi:hypothetical protein
MKISKMLLTAAISAGIATTIIAAICTVNHQYPCSHQHPSGNLGPCISGPVLTCDGIYDSSSCTSSTNAYQINNDFPRECVSCLTTNNGSDAYYTEHHNWNSELSDCYRSVRCKWNASTLKCEIDPGSTQEWYKIAKYVRSDCQ